MNELKLFLCRGKEVASLILLCFLALTTWAGETKNPPIIASKTTFTPLVQPNSTFHSDLTMSYPERRMTWEHDIEPYKQLAKTLNAHWLKKQLIVTQEPLSGANGSDPANSPASPAQRMQPSDSDGVQWKPLLAQAATFLWIEHTFRLLTEPGTRAELRGPFFKDWFTSVDNLRGWRDGDPFIVNYIGHAMQGSITNYLYVHNDPKSINLEMGMNKAYFKSRLKAMLFSTVYSTQFEIGPISEASLGNVGRVPTKTSRHPAAFVDLVVTPTVGTMWMMGEEALDRYLIKRIEDHVENRVVRLLVRSFLNPSKSFANVLRGRYPWNRDGRRL
jgi:hypothetical protein